MANPQRPDGETFLSQEPDVEGHLGGATGVPIVNPDEDVEGHGNLTRGDKPIDR